MCNVATFIRIFSTAVTVYTCIQPTSGAYENLGPFTEIYLGSSETPRAFHRITFPVKPFYYPFSDTIKIGMKFRNIKCTLPVIYRIIKNNNNYTIFSYFNFIILSESALGKIS